MMTSSVRRFQKTSRSVHVAEPTGNPYSNPTNCHYYLTIMRLDSAKTMLSTIVYQMEKGMNIQEGMHRITKILSAYSLVDQGSPELYDHVSR